MQRYYSIVWVIQTDGIVDVLLHIPKLDLVLVVGCCCYQPLAYPLSSERAIGRRTIRRCPAYFYLLVEEDNDNERMELIFYILMVRSPPYLL